MATRLARLDQLGKQFAEIYIKEKLIILYLFYFCSRQCAIHKIECCVEVAMAYPHCQLTS